jgi:NAD(P)-dependent dehydrogenase (short-subunit alcohol dehydrogenase family)
LHETRNPIDAQAGVGAIVNTSSGAEVKGFNVGGAAYGAAKQGAVGLTEVAALDYAQSTSVSTLCVPDPRHAHDAAIPWRHPRWKACDDCTGTSWKNGNA